MKALAWKTDILSGGRPFWTSLANGSSVIFSLDGRFAIVMMLHELRVYFMATRQCIRTIPISLKGVIQGQLDPENQNQIVLFKESGEVMFVNWKERLTQPVVATININKTKTNNNSSKNSSDNSNISADKDADLDALPSKSLPLLTSSLVILSVIPKNEFQFYFIIGKKDSRAKVSPHTRSIYLYDSSLATAELVVEVKNSIKYAISLNKKKIVFVLASNEVVLYDLANELHETINFPYKTSITSVAVSNDSVIALGTISGAIQILYGGLDPQDSSRRPQRLLKWHIDQVKSLQFTADNTYLISGGLEKVLVFWQLETDKTHFLPRLNGTIERISIDSSKSDYYTLLLNIPIVTNDESSEGEQVNSAEVEDESETNNELLVISAVDLVSRLSVNSARPKFAHSAIRSSLIKTNKRFQKLGGSSGNGNFDTTKLRYDYTSMVEIHPRTQFLYFPRGGLIQVYDPIRNEQIFTQNAVSVLQMGKVRSESKLIDPNVSLVSFSNNGDWMCTFDSITTSKVDNLLSKNDHQYSLKFWKYIDNVTGKNPYWELSSKIIDPHGPENPVLSIASAPVNYHGGLAFITADAKGGLRIWRPRIPKDMYQTQNQSGKNPQQSQAQLQQAQQQQPLNAKQQQTAWTLRKSKMSGALASPAVSVTWSEDGSLIILGHESTITAFNTHTLEESNFQIPPLSGSRIRYLDIVDHYLVVVSKTRITTFDLLSGKFTALIAKVNSPIGGSNLVAVDKTNNLICLALNYYEATENNSKEIQIKSKILIFKPDSLVPIYSTVHNQGISSIRKYKSGFIFVDLDSRVGTVSSILSSSEENENDVSEITRDMNKMLESAKSEAEIAVNRMVTVVNASKNGSAESDDMVDDEDDESNLGYKKIIDLNKISPIFENMGSNEQIESLFDKIIGALN